MAKQKKILKEVIVRWSDQFIISDTEDNLQKAVYLLYNISKEYNLEIAKKDEIIWFSWKGSPKNKNYYKWWNTRTS